MCWDADLFSLHYGALGDLSVWWHVDFHTNTEIDTFRYLFDQDFIFLLYFYFAHYSFLNVLLIWINAINAFFSVGLNTLYNICHVKISLQSFYLRIFCFGEFHKCQKFCCCKSRQSNAQSHIVQIILEFSQLCEFGLKIAV